MNDLKDSWGHPMGAAAPRAPWPGTRPDRGLARLRAVFERRMARWLDIRMPAAREQTLNYRSIFIFPSRPGLVFLAMLGVLLLAAINYQNSMLYAFTFLLGAVFALSILHCYRNLSGLTLALAGTAECFPGERAVFRIRLRHCGRHGCQALELGWPEGGLVAVALVDATGGEMEVGYPARRRGRLRPGRLLVQSSFPLGLIRAWSWLDLGAEGLVYPKPLAAPATAGGDGGEGERTMIRSDGEDYQGLRQFTPGDSLRRVAWKQFAQKDELFVKDFSKEQGMSLWLDLRDYPGTDLELRLSYLCHRVLDAAARQQPFGLRLGTMDIGPGQDGAHRLACLRALGDYRSGHDEIRTKPLERGSDREPGQSRRRGGEAGS